MTHLYNRDPYSFAVLEESFYYWVYNDEILDDVPNRIIEKYSEDYDPEEFDHLEDYFIHYHLDILWNAYVQKIKADEEAYFS